MFSRQDKQDKKAAPVKRENYLVISAVGKESADVLLSLTRTIANHQCTVLDCRMTLLGEETATYVLVTGPWDAVSRLENGIRQWRENAGFQISLTRTPGRPNRPGMPYSVNLVAVDGPGIIHDTLLFFSTRQISIDDMQTNTQEPPQSDTRVFSMNMIVRLPVETHLPAIREEFMLFCDERNLDAVIEPLRTS